MRKLLLVTVVGAFLLAASVCWSGIPHLIHYQGMLTDDEGTPLNTPQDLTFTIYNDSTGGTLKWTETQYGIMVTDGLFNVNLGDSTPIDLAFDEDYWLEIEVGVYGSLSPRTRLTSVGYAYRAEWADTTDHCYTAQKADTASYALAGGEGDKDWIFRITDTADTTLMTGSQWGIARYGNVLYGSADSTHVNLGVACTTGASGQDYKYCTVGGGHRNTASGNLATVGGGAGNTADSNYATVGGGAFNDASGHHTTVGGGSSNTASATGATLGGGLSNTASGPYATLGGGGYNTASGNNATVGGGDNNTASGNLATVGGGGSNIASGRAATIGGGQNNTASGDSATITGGANNTASGEGSTIAGGSKNTSSSNVTTVGGGRENTASYTGATIAGGYSNDATGWYSMIGGGQANTVEEQYATVGGGFSNNAMGRWSTIAGGSQNAAGNQSGDTAAFVGGGSYNAAIAMFGTVCGGHGNYNEGTYSVICGGYKDTLTSGADYSLTFGNGVYLDTSYRVSFFDGANSGKLGINRDDREGGINHPIHVGTDATNGNGAHLTAGGIWNPPSSRLFKEDFQSLDGEELLLKIINMPVQAWEYKNSDERHIGPVAEDFVEAFDVGTVREDGARENKYLASVDVAGVALAGVKELIQQNQELRQTIEELKQRIAELERGK
ncbi:MAG: tail fiber domain-containing protein [Candidatus Zixiibacteriota bacterium]